MRSWRHWPGVCPGSWEWKGWIRGINEWFQIYEHLQSVGAAFIYIQIFCALVGSLGKSYSGVPVAELAVSLFALVAIESGSHQLFKVYVLLLGCSLLVDIIWFTFIALELRSLGRTSSSAGLLAILILEAVSCVVRLLSSVIWYRIYHLGISTYDALSYQPVAFDARLEALNAPCFNSLLAQEAGTSSSSECGTVAGSIYDLPYYSSLFEDAKDGSGDKQLIMKPSFESSSCNPG